jgi:hypothetical protein
MREDDHVVEIPWRAASDGGSRMKTSRAAPAIRQPRRRRLSGAAGGNIDADKEISLMVGS